MSLRSFCYFIDFRLINAVTRTGLGDFDFYFSIAAFWRINVSLISLFTWAKYVSVGLGHVLFVLLSSRNNGCHCVYNKKISVALIRAQFRIVVQVSKIQRSRFSNFFCH